LPKFKKKEPELKTHFDKWLYVLTHLSKLQDRPKKLQERVFKRLFEQAEIAKFTPEEKEAYEESLKSYRDIKNVVDTSREEGRIEGIEQEKRKANEKQEKTIIKMYQAKISKTEIASFLDIPLSRVEEVIQKWEEKK